MHLLSQMHFKVSHIFKEENFCADKMTNIGLSTNRFRWDSLPSSIWNDLNHNRLSLPLYMFVNFGVCVYS
jgi:hypothetical protein